MHVMCDKIAIDAARRSPENNTAMAYRSVVELRDKQESSDAWSATHQSISCWSQRLLQKMLKNAQDATYFLLKMDSPWRTSPIELIFSSNWHWHWHDLLFSIYSRLSGQNLGATFGILGVPLWVPPQKGRRPVRDQYVPSCKISRRLVRGVARNCT